MVPLQEVSVHLPHSEHQINIMISAPHAHFQLRPVFRFGDVGLKWPYYGSSESSIVCTVLGVETILFRNDRVYSHLITFSCARILFAYLMNSH